MYKFRCWLFGHDYSPWQEGAEVYLVCRRCGQFFPVIQVEIAHREGLNNDD